MPARKTTAAQREQALNRRKTIATIAIGAIPVAILVIIGSIFLYNRVTGLGSNELPSSLGEGERTEIRKSIDDFYGYVNQYNPEFISSTMLPIRELGSEEFSRLVMEVAALQSEAITFRVQTLGSTSFGDGRKYVQARVATNYGNRDIRLVRRDGRWKISEVPDLLVPQEAGPMRAEWSVTHSFTIDPGQLPAGQPTATPTSSSATPASTAVGTASGAATAQPTQAPQKTLYVVGRIRNLSTEPGYILSASGFVTDGAGKTVASARPQMPGNPYLDPGEETFFQISFRYPVDAAPLDVANFVFVPDFRQVGRTDESTFVSDRVVANPSSVTWRPQMELATTVTNGDTRQVAAQVFAFFLDGSGAPQFIMAASTQLTLPPGYILNLPVPITELPSALSAVRTIEFRVFATPPRPASR